MIDMKKRGEALTHEGGGCNNKKLYGGRWVNYQLEQKLKGKGANSRGTESRVGGGMKIQKTRKECMPL